MTERRTQSFDIIGGMKLFVEADVTTTKRPVRIEECHGEHRFNEDEINVNVVRVMISLFDGFVFDITDKINNQTKEFIATELEVY